MISVDKFENKDLLNG